MKKHSQRVVKKDARSKLRRTRPSRASFDVFPGDHLRIVLTEKQIQKRVREMARELNHDSQGKTLHVIGLLENCFLFMADLVRAIKVPVICHFLKTDIKDSLEGKVAMRQIVYTPRMEVAGNDVVLVDGILQSGVTLDHLVRLMMGQNASSVRTAVLIEKPEDRKVDVATDYVGFKSNEKFLVGYGLGYHEKYRNLPHIATRT